MGCVGRYRLLGDEGGLTIDGLDRLELRRLLRDAADAAAPAETAEPEPQPQERVDRERVIELGVTGFLVRFSDTDNPVLLEAISRIQGWRPNPAGSHHVPIALPAVTGLLAFAEMYDFELTDGADAMVRQLIRESYRARRWHTQAERDEAKAATAAPPAVAPPRGRERWRALAREGLDVARTAATRSWRWAAVALLLLYVTGPRVDVVREPERAFLEHARLGNGASVSAVLEAIEKCGNPVVAAATAPPPGCEAVVATRGAFSRVAIGIQNPQLRFFAWSSDDGFRGFAFCDQTRPLEECWVR